MHFKRHIQRVSAIERTARLLQMEGIFDLEPSDVERLRWEVDVTLPERWQVGAIVGASGTGKTTLARELAGELGTRVIEWRDGEGKLAEPFEWPREKSLIDGFPGKVSETVALLSSVGFSSPPAWRRPYHVLSNGQQFRANLARAIAEAGGEGTIVFDEFASLVHDQVAKVASAAAAKSVRRSGRRLVAVSWREDIIDYLEPDWVIYMHPATDGCGRVEYRENVGPEAGDASPRGSLWRRPKINLKIIRTDRTTWAHFAEHHYLSGDLHKGAACFAGLLEGKLAAFTAVISFPHPTRPAWREHRTVCLPDFQGVGIGNAMSEAIASLFVSTGKPYLSTTSHPSMIRHRMKSKLWRTHRRPGFAGVHHGSNTGMRSTGSTLRLTAGFEFVGPANLIAAKKFGVVSG